MCRIFLLQKKLRWILKCRSGIAVAIILLLATGFLKQVSASDIREVLPLTNKIIIVHFDDGSVNYPNALTVNRLVTADADKTASWSFSSSDDTDFQTAANPTKVGRKTKGTEFVKDAPWGGNSADPRSKPWASENRLYLFFDKEMKPGKTYTLNTGTLAKNGSLWSFTFDEKNLRSEAIHVNTLGYDPYSPKYGYIYQWMGNLGNLDLTAYSGKKFWIYKEGIELPVKQGAIQKRKTATNAETGQANDTPNKNFLGAEVYECDFSNIKTEGTYKLVVEGIGSSYPFKIGTDAIWDAYYNVARAMYHQRSGIRLAPPYTAPGYIRPVNQNTKVTSDDGASFAGKLLYSDYPFMDWADADGGGASKAAIRAAAEGKPLDVAGWYHDAGDWDSYWTHQRVPMLLMATWEYAPDRFGDNELIIPESGNGIPDLVDEASWLIKFNYRLRKELKAKGYSNGGVGGARVCADVYTEVDGNSESNLPSWKEKRRTVVTKADAFMTYMYAGEAAQFACILKRLGKDPENFPVEMLDAVDFAGMSKDNVNWIKEAEEAYAWASAPENKPAKGTNYESPLEVYKMYAAANLFRLTGKAEYHNAAKTELAKISGSSIVNGDKRWGVYSYLLSSNKKADKNLQNTLKNAVVNTATTNGINTANTRACRWGGDLYFPMLVGQGTTPAVVEVMIAACLTGEKKYTDVVHTTADYFLGTNPLHTTWITGVGPRPAECGFHLDSRYNNKWVTYPGWIPYGPWSMAYDYNPFTWVIDGISMTGGAGSWDKDWANFTMYPTMENWPGHERWNSNIHAPLSTENTIHQNSVYGAVTYGFVNNRHYTNGAAEIKFGSINLNKTDIELTSIGMETELMAAIDINNATFSALKWSSSDPLVASVDENGRVTAVNEGTCVITCSALDGSVSATCNVTCIWREIAVDSIAFNPDKISLLKGQTQVLNVVFYPENATYQMVEYSLSVPGIATIDENGKLTTLAAGNVTVTATSESGKKKAICEVTIKEETIPAHKEEVLLDFETIELDWSGGYGAYSWNTDQQKETGNPSVDAGNASAKVFQWTRDISGGNTWGGYGIVLPLKNTGDWERISFQVYVNAPVSVIRLELYQGEASKGAFTLSNLNVPANKWTSVSFNLADLGMINKTFDKLQVQIAGGSDLASLITFSDNFKFEKGPLVSVPIISSSIQNIKVFPNPATGNVTISFQNEIPSQKVSINLTDLTGKVFLTNEIIAEKNVNLNTGHLAKGIYILKVKTGSSIYSEKLVIQ
ncbi:MAG TPA: Ig-like domain-containing protein [Draconibacterium sp.]|nr:Ig-like domain-containing protein [Draconibacterium sp.]